MVSEPAATHRLAHVTDSHFVDGGLLHGSVPSAANYAAALRALESTGVRFDALIHTGDVTDAGTPSAYDEARRTTEVVVRRTGWPVVWVAGNHDLRSSFRTNLLGVDAGDDPLDFVTEAAGLRIIALDTSIPGHVEGELDAVQLEDLRRVLAKPAPHGTVLALHHPPVPVEVTALRRLHLVGQDGLAAAIAGTDVRAILAGHLHYATASTIGGVPVFVAPSTAYTIRLVREGGGVVGADAGQAAGVLSLYDDGRVGYTGVPVIGSVPTTTTPEADFAEMGVDPATERRAAEESDSAHS